MLPRTSTPVEEEELLEDEAEGGARRPGKLGVSQAADGFAGNPDLAAGRALYAPA